MTHESAHREFNESHFVFAGGQRERPPADAPPHVITKRAITGWALYDLANTIISNMALFTKNVAENSGMNQNQADEQAH